MSAIGKREELRFELNVFERSDEELDPKSLNAIILPKYSTIDIKVDPRISYRPIAIYSDYHDPKSGSKSFRAIKLTRSNGILNGSIVVERRGSNIVFACFDNKCTQEESFFLARINVGGIQSGRAASNINDSIDLNNLCIQTHLMQSMGPFSEWDSIYRFAKASGFNCIHVTPVNKLSEFGSAFAISSTGKLNQNIFTKSETWSDLKRFVANMYTKYNIRTICDIVPNHCSTESKKLKSKANICVNLHNSPFLRSDYHMDLLILKASKILSGTYVRDKMIMEKVEKTLREVIEGGDLYEYFIFDKIRQMKKYEKNSEREQRKSFVASEEGLQLILDTSYKKYSKTVNFQLGKKYFRNKTEFRAFLENNNKEGAKRCKDDIEAAIQNTLAQFRWLYLESNGPKISPKISYPKFPLTRTYFFSAATDEILKEMGESAESFDRIIDSNSSKIFANSGWVMNSNEDYHAKGSRILFRRELNAWSDLVKYNFSSAEYLETIDKYSNKISNTFHGIRMDNCHSTPIEIVNRIVKNCRNNNPDCIVLSELFVSSEKIDHIYLSHSGIDLLIREMNNCHSAQDYSNVLNSLVDQANQIGSFYRCFNKHAYVNILPNVLYDQTHDNQPLDVSNLVPIVCLQALNIGAIGSTRGVDDLFGFKLKINEKRIYQQIEYVNNYVERCVSMRKSLLELHRWLNIEGFSQLYSEISPTSPNIQIITRLNPEKNERIIAILHHKMHEGQAVDGKFKLKIDSQDDVKIIREIKSRMDKVRVTNVEEVNTLQTLSPDRLTVIMDDSIHDIADSEFIEETQLTEEGKSLDIILKDFAPGSALILHLKSKDASVKNAIDFLESLDIRDNTDNENSKIDGWRQVTNNLDLDRVNTILFRIEIEERNDIGYSIYNIPNSDDHLPFAGIWGLKMLFEKLSQFGNFSGLGHPVCENIRDGDWLVFHQIQRLKERNESYKEFIGILEELFIDNYLKLPKFLKPKYFATIINFLCLLFEERCVLKNKHEMLPDFIKRLSVVSLQFYSSSNDEKFYRRDLTDGKGSLQHDCTLAAGMPHFASGLFRVWGRDTFISLRGLLLSFKRFEEAKQIILLFGRSMKGGLIPNLLGDGYEHAKYNSRDAVWWWLKSICDFCEIQGNESILEEKIILNHDPARKLITLGSLIHECLEQHSSAAPNNSLESIFVDESTGFVKGGTWHDSGTWMDKCDDSEERKPSTPRDGAAIELQALLYSVLCWFSRSSFARNNSEFLTVKWKKSQSMELSKWAEILKMNFVKNFLFVSSNRNGNKRFFKDTCGSSSEYADRQIRPNQTLAMHICPQLFPSDIAKEVWNNVDSLLCDSGQNQSQIGIKTLDIKDPFYRSYYSMADNYSDPGVHRGKSYHNGPEWVWVKLYHLTAMIKIFSTDKSGQEFVFKRCKQELMKYESRLNQNYYGSLEELTNNSGGHCADSCQSQAWSIAALVEFDMMFNSFIKSLGTE